MKRNITFCLLVFSLLLASCMLQKIGNSRIEKKILGRWDIRSIASSSKPDSVFTEDFNTMLRTLLINAFIEFSADHKFNAQIAGKYYDGNWAIDSKSKKLKLLEKSKEAIYSLNQVKESEIDLSTHEATRDYTVKLLRKRHLVQPKR